MTRGNMLNNSFLINATGLDPWAICFNTLMKRAGHQYASPFSFHWFLALQASVPQETKSTLWVYLTLISPHSPDMTWQMARDKTTSWITSLCLKYIWEVQWIFVLTQDNSLCQWESLLWSSKVRWTLLVLRTNHCMLKSYYDCLNTLYVQK